MRKVIFADDDVIVRKYLTQSMDWRALGFELCGAVGNGREALELILRLQPELAILDIDMPDMDGVQVLWELMSGGGAPNTKVLVLSCYNDFDYVRNAMRLGAVDYLLKHKTDSATLAAMVEYIFDDAPLESQTAHYLPSGNGKTITDSAAAPHPNRQNPVSYRREIAQAMEYIKEHLHENLSLEVLAEQVNFSKTYFSQLFKQSTGENMVDYIARLRINRAKELLINPDYKVYEVAMQVGFESQHYFNRLFKIMEGVTPTEYRYNHCYK